MRVNDVDKKKTKTKVSVKIYCSFKMSQRVKRVMLRFILYFFSNKRRRGDNFNCTCGNKEQMNFDDRRKRRRQRERKREKKKAVSQDASSEEEDGGRENELHAHLVGKADTIAPGCK